MPDEDMDVFYGYEWVADRKFRIFSYRGRFFAVPDGDTTKIWLESDQIYRAKKELQRLIPAE
jgi:hypothetical protein